MTLKFLERLVDVNHEVYVQNKSNELSILCIAVKKRSIRFGPAIGIGKNVQNQLEELVSVLPKLFINDLANLPEQLTVWRHEEHVYKNMWTIKVPNLWANKW